MKKDTKIYTYEQLQEQGGRSTRRRVFSSPLFLIFCLLILFFLRESPIVSGYVVFQ